MEKGEVASTRQRILAAAERLFNRDGLERTTVRAIAAAAAVNIAAVNYHFGSKEALERETLRLLADRANRDRLARLERCLAASGVAPPVLEDLVEALVAPYVEGSGRNSRPSLLPELILLLGLPGAASASHSMLATLFDEVAERFVGAFALALPGVSRAEIWWRYHLAIGSIVYSVGKSGRHDRLKRLSGGTADARSSEQLLTHLIGFVAAGLRGESAGREVSRPALGQKKGGSR